MRKRQLTECKNAAISHLIAAPAFVKYHKLDSFVPSIDLNNFLCLYQQKQLSDLIQTLLLLQMHRLTSYQHQAHLQSHMLTNAFFMLIFLLVH